MSGACTQDAAQVQVLIVPGLGDSGPGHWQTLWADSGPAFRRVRQRDFDHPQRADWIAGLDAELRRRPGPTVLVGHSLGCIAIAAWAQRHDSARVAGALLVAPADADALGLLDGVPLAPLPFPATVVASSDDPYCTLPRARVFAAAWGAEFVDHGPSGHLNIAAGFGPWPRGERLLAGLRARVPAGV